MEQSGAVALYLPDHNLLLLLTPYTNSNLLSRAVRETLALRVEKVGRTYAHKDLIGTLRHEHRPYTVAFVRHPLDWYASFWHAKTDPEPTWGIADRSGLWHPTWPLEERCADETFAGFVAKATDPGGFLTELFRLYTGRGTPDEIDHIGRAETMLDDLCVALDTTGVRHDRKALAYLDVDTSQRADYTPALKAMVAHAERDAFAIYGYQPKVRPSLIAEAQAERPMTLDDVPGWLSPVDRDLIRLLTDWQVRTQPPGDLVEFGVYLGKSAIVIGEAVQPGETFTVCDLFGGDPADAANERENQASYSTLTRRKFESNYLRFHRSLPVVLEMSTADAAKKLAPSSVRFLHVDASHLYEHVSYDVDAARDMLRPDGLVVFDDFRAKHTPGVAAAVWEAMFTKGLRPIADRLSS